MVFVTNEKEIVEFNERNIFSWDSGLFELKQCARAVVSNIFFIMYPFLRHFLCASHNSNKPSPRHINFCAIKMLKYTFK